MLPNWPTAGRANIEVLRKGTQNFTDGLHGVGLAWAPVPCPAGFTRFTLSAPRPDFETSVPARMVIESPDSAVKSPDQFHPPRALRRKRFEAPWSVGNGKT